MEVTPALTTLAFEGHPIRCFDAGGVMEWVATSSVWEKVWEIDRLLADISDCPI